MYQIVELVRKDCDAKDTHVDREVYCVEDLLTKQRLHLCPRCLLDQIRLRSKGKDQTSEA